MQCQCGSRAAVLLGQSSGRINIPAARRGGAAVPIMVEHGWRVQNGTRTRTCTSMRIAHNESTHTHNRERVKSHTHTQHSDACRRGVLDDPQTTTAQHTRQTRDAAVRRGLPRGHAATQRWPAWNSQPSTLTMVPPIYESRCFPERLRALVHARPPRVARSLTEARLQQLLQQHRRLPPVDCARECGGVVGRRARGKLPRGGGEQGPKTRGARVHAHM